MSGEQKFVELLGTDATMRLVEAFGGTRVTVSKTGPGRKALVAALGEADFKLLLKYFGGGELVVPMAKEWRLEIYKQRGLTRREMARLLGWHEKTVYAHLRGEKRLAGQLTLAFE